MESSPIRSPWLHRIALVAVCALLPLLFLGAEVTTKGVGMADSRPLVPPVQAVREFAEGSQSFGWRIEHAHRLAGWFVGICGVLLAVTAWLREPRRGIRWLATTALVLIGIQGLLGILRVGLHALWGPTLAWVHGSVAQVVFVTLVSVAFLTSRGWFDDAAPESSRVLRRWSRGCVVVVFLQLLLGGMARHYNTLLAGRLHLVGAFLSLAALLWLARLALEENERFRRPVSVLLGFLGCQIILGVEAWMSWLARYFDPALGGQETTALHLVRSAHYLLGAFVFAATVAICLKAHRHWIPARATLPVVPGGLEGGAA